jgi:glycosyltransferase involved in cell wall biosynthesis
VSEGARFQIALYAGVYVWRDAVSNSLAIKLDVLRRLARLGAPLELTVFTQGSDRDDPAAQVVPSVADLLAQDRFWAADLHIFEEGMYYDLFNSVFVIPPDRPILAIEHNTTPPYLVDVPAARAACERSLTQRYNLSAARHVACVSEFNLEIARSVGVGDDRLSVLHLPPAVVPESVPAPLAAHPSPVRVLYVGRFVRAKGFSDMLALVERLAGQSEPVIEVTLAGDPRFSDPELLAEVEAKVAGRSSGRLRVVLAPDDRVMASLFDECDALVIPSYHEGYCVPVIEAYGFGRFVIAYDAGNIANVAGGLGSLVPVGDIDELERAVVEFANALTSAREGTAAFARRR